MTLNLDEAQFSHLQNGDNNGTCLVGFLRGFNKVIHGRFLANIQACRKHVDKHWLSFLSYVVGWWLLLADVM